jgi:hypothetical protein
VDVDVTGASILVVEVGDTNVIGVIEAEVVAVVEGDTVGGVGPGEEDAGVIVAATPGATAPIAAVVTHVDQVLRVVGVVGIAAAASAINPRVMTYPAVAAAGTLVVPVIKPNPILV